MILLLELRHQNEAALGLVGVEIGDVGRLDRVVASRERRFAARHRCVFDVDETRKMIHVQTTWWVLGL